MNESPLPDMSAGHTPSDPIAEGLAKADPGLLPNIFLVGVMKSGTSWLARQLQLHRDVFLPGVKEPNLLMKPIGSGADFGLKGPLPAETLFHQMHRFSAATVPAYTAMYSESSDATPLRLDASVRYLSSDLAADRLARLHADHGLRPRILILLRNPAERTWSHWQMHRSMGVEPLSVTAALDAEVNRMADGWSDDFGYKYYSRYDLHLQRYLNRFDRTDIHVEIFEEMIADRAAATDRVFRFLNIDSARADTAAQDHRVRGKIKTNSSGMEQVSIYYRPAWRKAFPKSVRSLVWRNLSRFNRRSGQRQLPASDRKKLETEFAPMVRTLEQQLGRRLPWPGGQGL